MSLPGDLSDLINAGIISPETAERIREYYKTRSGSSANRLFIAFGIFGAILVGLGIILIIAHNWDELSRSTKTVLSFLPMIAGQAICAYVLLKKQDSVAWRESSAAFLFFAVGAGIALVSQIYNIPGDMGEFLLTWMLLCLPLIYLMNSSIASLLYLCGISSYAVTLGYFTYPSSTTYLYWLLLAASLPHYYRLYRQNPEGNFMIFHHWVFPLSPVIILGTVAAKTGEFMYIAYFSLFGLLCLAGDLDLFTRQKIRNNGYAILGSLGTIVLLLILSFDDFWSGLRNQEFRFGDILAAPELIVSIILSFMAGFLLVIQLKNKGIGKINPLSMVFIIFILAFITGMYSPAAVVLINIIVFVIGILTIRNGAVQNHLGLLNFGLLVIAALVVCRFFDTDLSFVTRGLLFVTVGIGFFAANYRMLKKRKTHE